MKMRGEKVKGIGEEGPGRRNSHSCVVIGDDLSVFGGTDGTNPLKNLHILNTNSHTRISPSIRGEGPEACEGHSAAVVGKRLLIFSGHGRSADKINEIGVWTNVTTTPDGSSARISVADDPLEPFMSGVLVFIGGCSRSLEALDDMYYLHTGKLNRDRRSYL
ncbi:hypothetical protein VNO77_44265 [Canavalia gladiata]|uniref:Uncharacterized protein n=1 Tax=Canavalia gladiata TaxID=3824 RepID=A0AAN9PQ74_CANGL